MSKNNQFDGAEVISTYSRAECIADGFLVDVSLPAAEAGFTVPVAVSHAAWADCIEWRAEDSLRQTHQDQEGRLWDLLSTCFFEAYRKRGHNAMFFELYRIPRNGKATTPDKVQLKALMGPGDSGEPVMTILKPNEN